MCFIKADKENEVLAAKPTTTKWPTSNNYISSACHIRQQLMIAVEPIRETGRLIWENALYQT
jgi:hypothetical protein